MLLNHLKSSSDGVYWQLKELNEKIGLQGKLVIRISEFSQHKNLTLHAKARQLHSGLSDPGVLVCVSVYEELGGIIKLSIKNRVESFLQTVQTLCQAARS